ncbi:hypothetical protein ACP4OV_020582 [Aristida adscensionis]
MAASAPPHASPPAASPVPTEEVAAEAVPVWSPSRTMPGGRMTLGTATLVSVFAGMLWGGSKEATASVSKDAEVMLKMGSTTDKREQYRLMRDAMEKRFIRVAKGSLVGGVKLGVFTGIFFGIQNLLIERRGVHDVFNFVGAGTATTAAYSLIGRGSMMWRARNVLVGAVGSAVIGFPLGWIQLKLLEMARIERARREIANSKPSSDLTEEKGNQSRVGAAIERLEGSLKK